MTWMNREECMKQAIRNAWKSKMLSGSRLVLHQNIYDTDQILIYEPLNRSDGSVMNVGMVLKDSLGGDLSTMLDEGRIVIVEFNIISIASADDGTLSAR